MIKSHTLELQLIKITLQLLVYRIVSVKELKCQEKEYENRSDNVSVSDESGRLLYICILTNIPIF